ncbi:MAG TPA: hypothetical protein VEH27_12280 [Methylomirabilota bacterium]|nr:hypothetical protein [Methylomirabilota bacterium]
MKSFLNVGLLAIVAALSITAAEPKDEVKAAIEKLSKAGSYSWTQKSENANSQGPGQGAITGKVDKEGVLHMTGSMRDTTYEVVRKGDKAAIKTQDGWQSAAELEGGEGAGRFMGGLARRAEAPTAQAERLLTGAKALTKEGDAYKAELTEEAAKGFLTMRRGGAGGGEGPTVSGGKGTVKFWTKDGALSKYEYNVKGSVSFNGNDREVDRTTTVEIKDVGATTVTVPEDAKKKLS